MYIQPNTTIYLLKNIPLENTYDHTIYFSTKTEQFNWFYNQLLSGHTYNNQYYQRHTRDYLKIKVLADNIYDCNYMMFQNTSYGNKWFYAFITSIEYVNDNCTLVKYEIDVMQTWMFDYTLGQCFVEREHSTTDAIGDNLVPENLPTGEIMYAGETVLMNHDMQFGATQDFNLCLVVAAPFDKNGNKHNGTVTSGMYSGLYYNIFSYDPNAQTTLEDQIIDFFNNALVQTKSDEIVTMFYYFKEFAVQTGYQDTPNPYYNTVSKTVPKDYSGFKYDYTKPDSGSGSEAPWTPKNNKLFTAPYNFFTVTDWQGNAIDFCYEYFNNTTCDFRLKGGLSCTPAVAFIPCKYMGKAGSSPYYENIDYAFWFADFPKVPWNTDGFIAWLAQTGVALAGKVAGDWISSGALGALGSNLVTGVSNFEALKENNATAYANTMMDRDMILHPSHELGHLKYNEYAPYNSVPAPSLNVSIGNIMAGGAVAALKGRRIAGKISSAPNWGINNIRVSAVHKKIRREWAERIDQYFSMFGYATMKVKVPNLNARTSWTYTKTHGCVMAVNNLPNDDSRKICSIYDKGITFWNKNATVGDYTQPNNVLI